MNFIFYSPFYFGNIVIHLAEIKCQRIERRLGIYLEGVVVQLFQGSKDMLNAAIDHGIVAAGSSGADIGLKTIAGFAAGIGQT